MGGIVSAVGNAVGSIFGGGGSQQSAPATPDYTGAAQATAQGNLEAARAAAAANRINQVTPYGNLTYTQNGTDSYGNPMWTATTSLSDVGQKLLNNQNQTALGLGNTINAQLGQVQSTMGKGFNPGTPSVRYNPDYQSGMAGWDKASGLLMQRLQPQMDLQQKSLDAKLAAQGVVPGTEAYNRAKMSLGMQQNDLMNQAQLSGLQAGNTLFNQGLQGAQFANQAQQQGYNQALTNYNLPLNTLSALRTGAQVQNPNFVNTPQQATTAGPDLLGATQMTGNYNLGTYNAQQAQNAGMLGGLMGLGGTLGGAYLLSGK
jgi:hypothetical protein